ncbi:MAG: amino acid adenylation domain-containing protein, partial [Cyanobacteria bacterium J06628_6]
MSQLYQQLLNLTPEQRSLFEKKLAEKGIAPPRAASIPTRGTNHNLPLSFAQQRLWFVQQLDPKNTAYNVASVLDLRGPLDITALEKSLNALVERHETLRTRFTQADVNQPTQVIDPPIHRDLPVVDLISEPVPQAAADARIKEIIGTPFDLTAGILRTALLRLETERHLLVLATHHIVSDRWSVMVFLREMTILYRAFSQKQPSPLSALPIQYADWALWQREQLQGEKLATQVDYWTQQLGGELPVLDLPRDHAYGAVASYRGGQVPVAISPDLASQLRTIASQYKVTLFTLLLTAFKVLLHRYTASDDIVVGSDVANRDHVETEGLIGLLVNTLVFRSDLSGNPHFSDLLLQVRDTVLSGFAHQDLPFEKLVEVINPERRLSQMMPLFQVKLDLQQANVKPLQLDGLAIERYPLEETQAKYEIRFNLQESDQGITGQVEYNRDLFDERTIERMVGHFQILLAGIATEPGQPIAQLPLLSEDERQTLLVDWSQTQRDYPTNLCIHELFEAQVEKTPDAIALATEHGSDRPQSLSYRDLNHQANQLAHYLKSLGVKAETRVGVCLPRTSSMIISLLATLKAGGTYVPLDPAYPSERLTFIVEDADISILLAQEVSQDIFSGVGGAAKIIDPDQIPVELSEDNIDNLANPDTLAYVIYTSGSTGRPKGVAIEHHSTVSLLYWAREEFSLRELSGVLAATSICFDLSVFEIFVPLSWGGRVVLVENALALRDLPESAEVRLINTVPSVLNQLLKVGQLPTSVQTVNLAGEALPATLVQQLQQVPQVKEVYNLYGPSEDTTYSTCAPLHCDAISANNPVPIGRPVANTQAYVLDSHQQPVPVGVAGELYLGGEGLARGYLNRPELTDVAFVSVDNLFQPGSSRLYKTGDRVRYRPDGQLEFLGRFDHQIKIRGFRIEIGEVEAALRRHPAVQDVVVMAYGDSDKQLVAYVVAKAPAPGTDWTHELRHDLSQQLPAHLVPTLWITLDALPQLPNGKVNRRALPQPQIQARAEYVAPRSDTEITLAEIWCDVLNLQRVSIHDNFFALGGHSLLAIQIVAQAETALGCKIPLRTLFQAPTVAGFAAQVSEGADEVTVEQRPQLTADLEKRYEPFSLTDIQQAYWLGRAKAFELGNIGTHGYREIEVTGLSITQIEQALNQLVERHDMLRAVVNGDGQQQILAQVPQYAISVTDVRSNTSVHVEQTLESMRDRLSHQVFSPDQWPLFQIEAAQLSESKVRFFVSFDVLIGDAWSFQLLGKEMAQLLRGDRLPPLEISFRDYVVAEQAFRETPTYQQALDYWQDRLPTLPPAPDLPLTKVLSQVDSPQFERRSGRLEANLWQQLKQRAYRANLTPSGVVLAAFAEILSTWSRQPEFTLNLTLFNRQPLHPDVNLLVGDFTASLLLSVDSRGTETFTARAQRLQTQLWNDLDHRAVSGVQVLRDLARQQNRSPGALMPVVFTSTLNQPIPASEQAVWQSRTVYSVSQTSQVYLDHQVSEIGGALVFNWDAIADLFLPTVLNQMFSAYDQLLHQLAEQDTIWQTYPQLAPTAHVAALNQTEALVQKTGEPLLHTLFWKQVEQQPDAPAIITPEKTLSYRTLAQQVQILAQQLQPMVNPNQLVAVSIPKGWQQVVAVLGILTAGAAYVPIDPDLPQERRWQLTKDTAAQAVVTTAKTSDWPTGVTQVLLSDQLQAPDPNLLTWEPVQSETDLAYVIYTSGSTGAPKGVMIDHRGAVNTILDINQRFGVGSCDRVFALSSLSFDLSAYDIFGTLAAGAAIVMPAADQLQNTAHWRKLLQQHQVTIWNSVPALMGLLLQELDG